MASSLVSVCKPAIVDVCARLSVCARTSYVSSYLFCVCAFNHPGIAVVWGLWFKILNLFVSVFFLVYDLIFFQARGLHISFERLHTIQLV